MATPRAWYSLAIVGKLRPDVFYKRTVIAHEDHQKGWRILEVV